VIERLPELVNTDPAIVRWGRGMNEVFLLQSGEEQFLLTVRDGKIEKLEKGPFVMRSWTFAIRASKEAWEKHWQSPPPPGWHDLFALLRTGNVVIEGDLQPLMAYLMYLKLVLAAPRKA